MITVLIGLAVAAVVSIVLIRVSIKVALVILLMTTFLVPANILIPGAFSGHPTIQRIVLLLLLINLTRKIVRGDVPLDVLRPTRVTLALFGWVVLTFVIGVALADRSLAIGFSSFLWIAIIEQFAFAVFVTAAIRIIQNEWWVAGLIASVTLLSAGIAVVEHFTRNGYGRWIAQAIRGSGYLGVRQLGMRGGDVRVQAGAEFALAFAWAATLLVPLVIVVASRSKHFLVRCSPALLVLAIAWTYARSAYVGAAAAVLLIVAATRFDRSIARMALVGALAVAAFVLVSPALDRTFSSPEIEGSTLVREERLPLILSFAADRPLTGKGLSSLSEEGIRNTDSSYLAYYGEMGAIGVGGFALLLVLTLWAVAPSIRADSPNRLIGAAALSSVILGIAASAFLGEFHVSSSARSFWLLASFGGVLSANLPRREPQHVRRRSRWRVVAIPVGVAVGSAWLALTPTHVAATYGFTTRTTRSETAAAAPREFIGRLFVTTVCAVIEPRAAAFGAEAQCYDLLTGLGTGAVRIEAEDRALVDRVFSSGAIAARQAVPGLRTFVLEPPARVKPSLVRTAPVWMGMAGATLALVVPPIGPPFRRPRRRASVAPAPA